MIEAVYIDLAASRSIVGIQPKPPFYNLFESLNHVPDNKVIIFKPSARQKETGSGIAQEPDYVMVETGESRTPLSYSITHTASPCEYQSRLLTNDSLNLFYALLDGLITIGDVARQLKEAINRNGHPPDAVQRLFEEIHNGERS